MLAIISTIPSATTLLVTEYYVAFLHNINGVEELGFYSALFDAFALLMALIGILTAAGVAAVILGVLKTTPPATWATVSMSIRYYTWPLIILSVLLGIIAFLITLPFSFVVAFYGFGSLGHGSKVVEQSYFIKLLAVLMAILYLIFVKYALADPLIVIEEMEPLTALKRSWQMTRGRFWYVLGCYVLVGTTEYFMLLPFQIYESPHSFNCAKAIDLLISGAFTCYWVLLAWCMYWRIRDAENPATEATLSPPESPSAAQSA